MPKPVFLGEFEQLLLLALLKIPDQPYAIRLRDEMNQLAGRPVVCGALYRTLDRLKQKGLVTWQTEPSGPERRGHVKRRFAVTRKGRTMLRASRDTLQTLGSEVAEALE